MSFLFMLNLIWAHFIADFVLQSDEMALGKSKGIKWLSIHITVYSIFMFVLMLPAFSSMQLLTPTRACAWVMVNAVLHFITDFISSRMTTWLWKKGDRHNFFVVIGADQALHMTALVGTAYLMFFS